MKRYEAKSSSVDGEVYLELYEHGELVWREDTLDALVEKIEQWGTDKAIIGPDSKATIFTQFGKLCQEVEEVSDEIEAEDTRKLHMEMGDVAIVLALMANMSGSDIKQCLQMAYDKISKRTGKMIDGTFVKDES